MTTVTIKTTDWVGRPQTDTVAAYVERNLYGYYDGGALEEARHASRVTLEGLSRLVEVLAARGLLTATEVTDIAGGRAEGAHFE